MNPTQGNSVCSYSYDEYLKTLKPYDDKPLSCNYCDELFDSEQLKPTYYLKKYCGLACPECLIEVKNSKNE